MPEHLIIGGQLVVDDPFDRLLGALPKIVEAINGFESAEVQAQAFEALVRALDLGESADIRAARADFADPKDVGARAAESFADSGDADDVETETTTTTTRRKRRRSAGTNVSADSEIDFRPVGKQAFREFVAEKAPASNPERNVIAVYYLERVLGLSSIGASQVLAAYKDCNWREPNSMVNSLQVTASTKNWINTSDMTAIRTTPSGRNTVEHDMPTKPKKASKA